MKQEDLEQLESRLLATDYPEEGVYNNGESASIGKKLKKKIKARPTRYLLYLISTICGAGVIIMSILIVNLLTNPLSATDNETGSSIEGFTYLMEQGKDENTMAPQIDEESQTMTSYYVNPTIRDSAASDSYIQIGEKAYKLPITLSQLEADGIVLITLGVQPPAEDVILNPQMRNGYLQFENKRFAVTLKNGIDCTYHDLKVVEISAEESGSPIYIMGGLTIGSEEAAIPQNADRIEQDALQTTTYYYWGAVEDTFYNVSGRMISVAVSNQTGKIEKISVFDDGSAGSEN